MGGAALPGRERVLARRLDVTDPEPLPDGHPLWDLPNCLITPHTANTLEMAQQPPVGFTTELTRLQRKILRLLGMSGVYNR